jgi:hypothetical protein
MPVAVASLFSFDRVTAAVRRSPRPPGVDELAAVLRLRAADLGERGTLCLVCEALGDLLGADCLASRVDLQRGVLVDLAGFTRTPERFNTHAAEYSLAEFPATVAVLESGAPYATHVSDPRGDPAELAVLRDFGYRGLLLLRMRLADDYLFEVWGAADAAFSARDIERAQRLVEAAVPVVAGSCERDRVEAGRFAEAMQEADELGRADHELPALAEAVGEAMGLDERTLRELRLVALVHDVGKRAVPPALLGKQEPLTAVEWAVVQRQTMAGQRMLARMPHLAAAVESVGAVREAWDGSGYPRGLIGEEIPAVARIVHVCAAYRAMLRPRPGREQLTHEGAIAELRTGAGAQFDPRVVVAACQVLGPDGVLPMVRLRAATI